MPVYAYRCESCGVQFERMQRFSDDPVSVCPECEQQAVRRVIQPAGIIFKGSGWYVNDSKASNSAGKPGNKESVSTKDSKGEKSSVGEASTEKTSSSVSKDSSSKDAGGTKTSNND
ncbi:MAG: zinc ribbon domain-containing protein [Anaerolineales bacterium]|jgi:putative FmdB family regulatory protein|nr:zinc ribbon domain-containing protein [Anaerolineales bacterium]